MSLFWLIFLIPFSYLCFKKPLWALCFILAFLPLYQIRFHIIVPFSLLEIEILILALVNLVKWAIKKQRIVFPHKLISYLIVAFLIIAVLTIIYSPNLKKAAGYGKAYFIEPVLLAFLAFNLVRSKKDLLLLVKSLCGGVFWISLWAISQKFLGGGVFSLETWGEPKIWRATGPFPHPNFLGLYLGPIIPLCLGLFLEENSKKKRFFWLICFFLGFIALILARSEGAILATSIASIFFLLFISKTTRKIIICFLIVFLISFSFNFLGLKDKIIPKITLEDLSGQLRLNIWQGAVKMLEDSPILGVGLGGYEKMAPLYQERYYNTNGELVSVETHPYPHNLFLAFYLELGFFGFLFFCLILGLFFSHSFVLLKKQKDFLILGAVFSMITILIHGLVDTPYFKNDLSVLFWIIFSLPLIFNHIFYETKD
jgi:putative inorganic carbon (HCO3(-)) transporter